MTEIQRRAFTPDLEIRSSGDGRTVHGIAVPFDSPTPIREFWDEYDETFARGAFTKTIAENGSKVKFLDGHDRSKVLGKATELREDANGLYAEFKVSKTQRGDDVLELIRDGALDSFSIGFSPVAEVVRQDKDKVSITRTEVKLRETSVVPFPAYDGALIGGVRSVNDDDIARASDFIARWRAGESIDPEDLAVVKQVIIASDRSMDEMFKIPADKPTEESSPRAALTALLARQKVMAQFGIKL